MVIITLTISRIRHKGITTTTTIILIIVNLQHIMIIMHRRMTATKAKGFRISAVLRMLDRIKHLAVITTTGRITTVDTAVIK